MKIAVIQPHAAGALEDNRAVVERLLAEAAAVGADLALLPEMSVLEFFPRHAGRYEFYDLAEPLLGPTFQWFQAAARRHGLHVVYNHYERSAHGLYFDTSVVVSRDGDFVGRQRMMHLAEEPGYNEKFYYTPGWDTYHVHELDDWRFGIAICYDRHFPEVFRSFQLQGADCVLVPTAVSRTESFAAVYEFELRAAALTHGMYLAVANRAGEEPPLSFIGESLVIDPLGTIVARAGAADNATACATFEREVLVRARYLFPFLRDRRPETYGALAASHASFADPGAGATPQRLGRRQESTADLADDTSEPRP